MTSQTAADLNKVGHEAYTAGDVPAASGIFESALALDPHNALAWRNLGAAQSAMENRAAALVCFERATRLAPKDPLAWSNLGHELFMMGRFDDAVSSFGIGVAALSDLQQAAAVALHHNLGLALLGLRDWKAAEKAFDIALHAGAQGNHAALIRFDRAHAILASGDLLRGFEAYECRFETMSRLPAQVLPMPTWTPGQPLRGESLLVFHEQGFGDTLQFCRFLQDIPAYAEVICAVPKALLGLLASSFPDIEFIDMDGPLPMTEFKTPMVSLARGTTLQTIPGHAPYLRVPKGREPFALARAEYAVGICWAGGHSDGPVDKHRSMSLEDLLPLASIPGVSLHALQVEKNRREEIYDSGANCLVEDLGLRLLDFADTAAAIMAMDAVVTVDTAVAHLAGALGKPVHMLSRFMGCWRWMGHKPLSPWYPTMTIHHQRELGSWRPAVEAAVFQIANRKALYPGRTD